MKRIKNVLIFFLAMVMLGACRDKKSEKKRGGEYTARKYICKSAENGRCSMLGELLRWLVLLHAGGGRSVGIVAYPGYYGFGTCGA